MLLITRFLNWFPCSFRRQQPTDPKDSMTLESLQFRIRSAILVISSLNIITSATKTDINFSVYIPILAAHFLYIYLFLKKKTEFFLGLPYLVITFISYMSALETNDGFYLRVLVSCNGTLAMYIVQGFSPYLTTTMAFGFIWLQRRYLYQLTILHEPITDSYLLSAASIDRFMAGWVASIVVESLCFITFQIILRNVWKQYQATSQSLEKTLEELKQTNMKLEKTVLELNELNKQLKMALESQDLFIACVSHELRNPLNALLGTLDLLDLEIKDQSQKESLKVARICGESLLGHINNLLDVAKINADKLEINELPTKLSVFLEKFWSFMRIGLNKKGLIGHLCVHRSLPLWIKIDEVRLQQILENLVGNAIKFTTSGSVRVTLSWVSDGVESTTLDTSCHSRSEHLNDTLLSLEDEMITEENVDEGMRDTIHLRKVKPKKMSRFNDFISFKNDSSIKETLEKSLLAKTTQKDGWFKIEVVDTGCGVTEEAYQKIFQPFTQGDSSITRKYGGTGLGLYIVKNLIEKMGGSVQLTSVKDIGTQFKILLPIKGIEGVETHLSRMPSQSFDLLNDRFRQYQQGSTSSQGNIRYALIVDDDAFNQNIMKNYIETLGFEVDIAVDGLEGVQMYQKNPGKYTFIAMDIQMPVMDGITACKKIRMHEKAQDKQKIPIIIVTGNCSEAEQKACLEDPQIGANYFFRKPFRFLDCKICVQKILLKHGMALKEQSVSH